MDGAETFLNPVLLQNNLKKILVIVACVPGTTRQSRHLGFTRQKKMYRSKIYI